MLALLLDGDIKEGVCMKYFNARAILPEALVKELQQYVQCGYIYVPIEQRAAKALGRGVRLSAGIGAA